MSPSPPIDYRTACLYAGQLFLESRHQLELLTSQVTELQDKVTAVESERDTALSLLNTSRSQQ